MGASFQSGSLFGSFGKPSALSEAAKNLSAEQQQRLQELDALRIRLARTRGRGELLSQNVPSNTLG
jgi:hypothetical protein